MNTASMNQLDLTGVVALDIRDRRGSLRPGLPTVLGSQDPNRRFVFAASKSKVRDIDFSELTRAYLRDSYVARAISRYVSICMTYPPVLEGPESVANYVARRLSISAYLNNMTTLQWLRILLRDFVLYGNVLLVKSRTRQLSALAGYSLSGRGGVVAGYFPVLPEHMTPIMDSTGTRVEGWRYQCKVNGVQVDNQFPASEVIHLRYNPLGESIWGVPPIYATIEDIHALRHIEESVLLLIDKFANPIIHVETPDILGTGEAVIEDMTVIANAIRMMSRDGVLVTAPGQKVHVIGAESIALRMEEYLNAFKRRVFSGLGANEAMIGEKSMEQKDVELDRILRDQALDIQAQFSAQFERHVITELLAEAGITNPVSLKFGEPDPLYLMKVAQAAANVYITNMMTEDEARAVVGLDPMTPQEYRRSNLHRVRIPLVKATADARAQAMPGAGDAGSDLPDGRSGPANRVPTHRVSDKTTREPTPRKR